MMMFSATSRRHWDRQAEDAAPTVGQHLVAMCEPGLRAAGGTAHPRRVDVVSVHLRREIRQLRESMIFATRILFE